MPTESQQESKPGRSPWPFAASAMAGVALPVASQPEWGAYLLVAGVVASVVFAMLAAVDAKSSGSLASKQELSSILLLGAQDPRAAIPPTKMRTAFVCSAICTAVMAISVVGVTR